MEKAGLEVAPHSTAAFFSLINNPIRFRLYLLKNLPAAYFSGLQLQEINNEKAIVTIPYKWFTKNPFRSTYFACLSMAAELSTGILAMAHIYKRTPPVSMLIVGLEGRFHKKATGITRFQCSEGFQIKKQIETAISTHTPQQVTVHSIGTNASGETVAEFWCEWSFKTKEKK